MFQVISLQSDEPRKVQLPLAAFSSVSCRPGSFTQSSGVERGGVERGSVERGGESAARTEQRDRVGRWDKEKVQEEEN